MTECNHECSSCGETCSDREENPGIKKAPMNSQSNVKKVIGIISGKGGVGKSSVTAMLASQSRKAGKEVAILDADITGPSIPRAFGITEKAQGNNKVILPAVTKLGIKVMSINLLLEKETDPVIWRGPMVGGVVEQFWSDVVWGDIDIMYIDMPPGTGDVALTVYQSLPIDGIIIVTSPQELVSMIVEKAVNMAQMMKIPVLGIVQNMAYFECSSCKTKHYIFGDSNIKEISKKFNINKTAEIPINPEIAKACDEGTVEDLNFDFLDRIVASI